MTLNRFAALLPACFAVLCMSLSGCGPKKGTGAGKTAAVKETGEKEKWEYCPIGYGWGPEFNEKVIAVLTDGKCNPKDRSEAAKMAGDGYMFDAVAPLMQILDTEKDVTLKLSAISSLGRFNTKRTLRPFIKLLDDKEPKIRSAAVEGLAMMAASGDLVATDIIKGLATDKDEEMRSIALISLGMAGKTMATDGLIELLKSENPTIRQDAVEALGRISNNKATAPLLAMLKDEDQQVRGRTCYALGQIGDSAATDPLLELLDDKEPQVRSAAAYAIGLIGDEKAIDPLLKAMKEADQNERWGYASALGLYGDRVFDLAKELASSDKKGLRQYGIDIVGRLNDTRALPILIEALDDKSEDVRQTAARGLSAGGKDAFKALTDRLEKEKSVDVRIEILRTIGYTGDSKAVPLLIAASKDDTARARAEAVRALGQFDDEKAIEALMEALGDDSEWVKESAVRALGYMKVKKALDAILKLLEDEDAYVKGSAASSLGTIGDMKAVEHLSKLLDDKNEHVRQAVITALGDIGGNDALAGIIKALDDEKEYVRESAIRALGSILSTKEMDDVTSAMIALARGLKDENFYVRETAAFSLARIQIPYTKEVIDALQEEMHEADDYLINEVFWALSSTKEKDIVSKMLEAYSTGDYGVETPIEEAIANAENEEVLSALKKLIESDDKYMRATAAIALALSTSSEAEGLILPFLKSGDPFLKNVAAIALETCGGSGSVAPLIDMLDDPDEDVVISSCRALKEIGRRTGSKDMVDTLIGLMKSDNHTIAMAAADSLATIGDEKALDQMMALFKDSADKLKSAGCGYMCGVVASLGNALAKIGGKKVSSEMLALLENPNPRVRREAVYVLMDMEFDSGEDAIIKRIEAETDLSIRDTLIGLTGRIKSKKAIPLLKKLLKDADNFTRAGIIGTIGKIGDKKQGKFIMGFLKDPVNNVKRSAIEAIGKLKYGQGAKDLLKMLDDEKYEYLYPTIIEALIDMGERDSIIEPFAKIVRETDDKFLLMYASFALAFVGYDAIRPTMEKRLASFGVSGLVLDVLAFLYGDATMGNDLYNKLRDVKITRNAGMMADIIMRAFHLKGEEGKTLLRNLVKEAKSGYVSSLAWGYSVSE
ncbi:MAG: HEAT repeat domain-containing protein [Pseudomonadota bacterium]